MSTPSIRPLTIADAEDFRALRLEGLLSVPSAFGSSYEEEKDLSIPAVRDRFKTMWANPPGAIFGAFDGPRLVGVIGIYQRSHRNMRHKMGIWGMYVTASHRGGGIGRALVKTALAHAKTVPGIARVDLTVESENHGAIRLYRSCGFELWGTEPQALKIGERFYDDHQMSLALR